MNERKVNLRNFTHSAQDGSFRIDRLPTANQRRTVSMATDVLAACLQEQQTRFHHQHPSAPHASSLPVGFIDSLSNYFDVNREEEGRDLLGKRTMDFKVSYLDAGLTSNYFSDESSSAITTTTTTISSTASATSGQTVLPSQPSTQPTTQKIGRKYKNQLRDFLTNCRTKRKSGNSASSATGGNTTPPEPSPYLSGSGVDVAASWTGGGSAAAAASSAASAAVAAAATAYSPSVYPAAAAAAAAAVPYHADNSFYHSMHHHHQLHHHQPNTLQNLQNLHQSFYAPALENRFGIPTAAEHNLFHHAHHGYRGLAGVGAAGYYAADYSPYVHAAAAATATNGFLAAGYDSTMGEFFSPSHVQFSEFLFLMALLCPPPPLFHSS